MKLPQFTAEESLLPTIGCYRTNAWAAGRPARGADRVVPAEIMVPGETIEIRGCAPGSVMIESGSDWDCIPRSLFDWLVGGYDGTGLPPTNPPGGGGGGGGLPAAIPPDIVADCLLVGGKFGEKYCGGVGGPSCCKACAQAVCQKKKCSEREGCDPSQLNGVIESQCEICCPDRPGCKDGLITGKGRFHLVAGAHAGPRLIS